MKIIKLKKISRLAVLIGLIVMVSWLVPLKALEITQKSSMRQETMKNVAPPVFSVSPPEIDINTWFLRIDGFVQQPLNLTYDELKALPAITVFAQLICYPSSFVTEGDWTGVRLNHLLTLVEVKPDALDMVFYAVDGFSSSLPVDMIMNHPDMILAYEKDGEPLTPSEGFPVIVVAPGQGGYKWVKYVEHIELVDYDHKGYWESAGYPDDASISTTPREETTTVPEFEIRGIVVLILLGLFVVTYKKLVLTRKQ